jgi:hypothetical protein
MGSLIFLELPITQALALDASVFANYLAALQAVGWMGESKLVRLGYTIAATLAGIRMLCLDLQGVHANMPVSIIERSYGHSVDEILAQHAGLFRFMFVLAAEAHTLLQALAI